MQTDPVVVVRQFMAASGRFHGGGPGDELLPLLGEDVIWHVPGNNAIAGTYRGREEVLGYFHRRRDQAGRSLRFVERRVLVADDLVLHFTGGSADVGGQQREWETVGVYRVEGQVVGECWLVPSDQALFDQVWQ